jgi:hypothetical protein
MTITKDVDGSVAPDFRSRLSGMSLVGTGGIMRTLTAAILLAVSAGALAQTASSRSVDLDRPGQLEALEFENPGHYLRIAQIREFASRMPCTDELRQTLAVKFEAADAKCTLLILTSYPSRRRLSFELDGTSYTTKVHMDESGYRFIPLSEGEMPADNALQRRSSGPPYARMNVCAGQGEASSCPAAEDSAQGARQYR